MPRLAAVQGVIQNNAILVRGDDISPFNGRTVTVIINESENNQSKQDKTKFFDAVGKIDIDSSAVDELRKASMI